ncbi:helix-turn-helix domain-containing protein [Streptomyces sp. NPDC004266]|uniref:helix-turn-helix domain-containing protein n=1 Tax=Streptomyces sp. NPDC004266 TaxID=3364693 RepID=UPI0036CAA73B
MMGTEEILRLTVAALMARTGERQNDLAAGLGLSQAQVSRKQGGAAHWSLEDIDRLAAHYRLPVLDLLAGPTHAASVLHGSVASLQPDSAQLPPAPTSTPTPATTVLLDEAAAVVNGLEREHPGSAAGLVRSSRNPAVYGQPGAPAAAPDASPPTASVQPCVLCGQPTQDELEGFPQHLTAEDCAEAMASANPPSTAAPAPAAEETQAPAPAAPIEPPAVVETPVAPVAPAVPAESAVPAPAGPRRSAPGYASGTLLEQIADRVHEVLAASSGDLEAAQAELIKSAIPDVMTLLKASRVGGRYEHSEFPPTQEILRKKSQKGADEIWEGRPKWRNPELFAAVKRGEQIEVTALDMNAAYLSAMKAWLPIGQLREDTSGVHDPKKAGVHLITPATWDHTDLPNPLGNRMEPGELWVSESTLRLLLDCARQGLADAPVIHRSLVSGASEALLEKLRRALAESRKTALAEGDELTVAYVKAMYSKFVSTIGESSANREIRRPDWMHIIRAKAFANLWMKAHKAYKAGLQVVEISGTDELHVVGEWRSVFPEGRDLNQVKEKTTYVLGGKR